MKGKRWFGVCFCLLFSACAQVPSAPVDPVSPTRESLWQERQRALLDYQAWNLGARLSVQDGRQRDTATIVWRRRGQTSRIDLFGAFGVGRVRITEDSEGAVLTKGDDDLVRGRSAEEVLYRTLGWHVPFGELGYWLRGLPGPQRPLAVELDGSGRLKKLNQSGWEVVYVEYRAFDGIELPRKIYLLAGPDALPPGVQTEDDLSKNFSVKIVINQWQSSGKN